METIIIKLNPEKLESPDLDLCYDVPKRIEEYSNQTILDNGYDYLEDDSIGLWLKCDNAQQGYKIIIELFSKEEFLENDLSKGAEIYISNLDCAELKDCNRVYP